MLIMQPHIQDWIDIVAGRQVVFIFYVQGVPF